MNATDFLLKKYPYVVGLMLDKEGSIDTEISLGEILEEYHREKIEEEEGVELGEMNKILLQKIEELTLYILELDESLKLKDVDVKTDYGQGVRHGYEILYDALIEKIKG